MITLKLRMGGVACAMVSALATVSTAQEATSKPERLLFTGTVTGNDVYVRSGPSSNYYPVIKLNSGATVKVTGEQEGWYAIVPPDGCFSLMHKNFIDRDPEGDGGVVNANAVLVRAGSETNPNQLYAKQAKLNRGAKVKILKAHDEDWLQIEPPADARLYISTKFVSSAAPKPAGDSAGPDAGTTSPGTDESVAGEGEQAAPLAAESAEPGPDVGEGGYQELLAELDAAMEAEWDKPLLHRDYAALIGRYQAVADQQDDQYARDYASARISQLDDAIQAADAVREMRALADEVTTVRIDADRERTLNRPVDPIRPGFDAVGVLRTSMIWDGRMGPRRFRLVSADSVPSRTIGYVEISPESAIDAATYLGRRVGVRATERRVETGDVDPVVVYVAAELVVVEPPARRQAERSPARRPVENP